MQPVHPFQDSPKTKRSIPASNITILEPEEVVFPMEHTTNISIDQFLHYLNISSAQLKNMVYVATNTDNPSVEQIEHFLLNYRIDTHSNTTVHIIRDKRHPVFWLVPAAIVTVIGVGLYFLINYIVSLFNVDLSELELAAAPPLATLEQLHTTNGHISELTINQNQIKQAVNDGTKALSRVKDQMLTQTFAIATWAAQTDVKHNIQFAIQILSDFILKLGSILLGALSSKTSPFALNIKELAQLKMKVASQYKNAILTDKLTDVKTNLINSDKNLTLLFTIPISNPDTVFTFYKVIPIPLFDNKIFFHKPCCSSKQSLLHYTQF